MTAATKPNVLFLVHRVPYPPNRGDRIRSYHMVKFLSERANVSLATLADEPVDPGTIDVLNSLCSRVAIEPLGRTRWLKAAVRLAGGRSATEGLFECPRLRRRIQEWSRQTRWDAVLVFCSSMVQYLDLPELSDVPAIVDLVDVDSQKFFDYGAHSRRLKKQLYQLEGRRLRRLECSLPGRVRAITLVSETEADLYRSFCPNGQTHAVGNGVDLEYYQPPLAEGRPDRFVFVGAMDYQPNVEGVVWFCEHVWPQFQSAHPRATFAIVGRNPVPAVCDLRKVAGVEVVGSVADVRPHLADAQITVIPLQIARGIQNKVLEAMALNRPVIASPQALEGLAMKAGLHVACAASPTEWLAQMEQYSTQPDTRRQMAAAGREFVECHHAWQACLQPLAALLPFTSQHTAAAA